MAHLWVHDEGGWGAQRLSDSGLDLSDHFARLTTTTEQSTVPGQPATHPHSARLIRTDTAGSKSWALISCPSSGFCVNGRTLPAGLCVLDDRDEILCGADKLYFSTETLAAVEPFPKSDRQVFCGRCRQLIETGSPAVCCPSCGIWYNESADLPCWTYAEKCTFCGHATALDAGFSWTPEEM